MNTQKATFFQSLVHWFQKTQRPLPWRESPSAYQVWVSEVMLQQTQAATVIPYYHRFLQAFPTLKDLAQAPLEKVLKLWEGLGYYSRARNLHAGAKRVLVQYGGDLPTDPQLLKDIKGIGPYTLGAIMAFAYKKPYAAVDGNVLRVVTRLFALSEDIAKASTRRYIQELVTQYLDEEKGYIVSEALIELGATLCKKIPQCQHCPMSTQCQARKLQLTSSFPYSSKKIQYQALKHLVWIFAHEGSLLVKKGEDKLMQDLYQFPFHLQEEAELFFQNFQRPEYFESLPPFKQSFTRYRVLLEPRWVRVQEPFSLEGYEWRSKDKLLSIPFSSGHKRILQHLIKHRYF